MIAAAGPASWLAVVYLPSGASPTALPEATSEVAGLLVVEGTTFLLARERVTRALLAVAMPMDLVPLSLFVLHMARASRY